MKTYLKTFLAVAAITFALTSATAQTKISEGSVVYTITMTDNDMDPQIAAMMPKEMTVSFKGDKSKSEMKMGMGMMAYIYDLKTKMMMTLMDMMGQKTVIKMTEAEMDKEAGKQPKTIVKYLDETKTICGYLCHKAEITTEDGKNKQVVYYTKDIVSKNAEAMKGALKGIDGFPLEYDINMNGISMKMTAKTVNKGKIDDSIFKVPEGYKEKTMDEIRKMGGAH